MSIMAAIQPATSLKEYAAREAARPRPEPVANGGDPRAALRTEIAARNAAAAMVRDATASVGRAKELVQEAEARLSAFGDVDGAIRAYRAAGMKAHALGGDKPDTELPADLIARRQGYDQAQEHIDATSAAHDDLVCDLKAAEAKLKVADAEVSQAAIAVMVSAAGSIAAELERARKTVWELSDQLHALCGLWLSAGGAPRPVALGPRTVETLRNDTPPWIANPLAAESARWRAWHTALMADAEAEF